MNQEIERKFRIDSNLLPALKDGHIVKQAYIETRDHTTVRVRLFDETGYLTIKGPTQGISRLEYEYPIPASDAEDMMRNLCGDTLIEKVRYRIPFAEHVWELDVFEGDNQGLIIAEIELASEQEAFERPDWLAEEVSHDARYFNSNLARHPYSRWD